ncbi:MAG: PhoU domain-containing protein [Candidatus Bathyarchaeia archaeon]|nr:potassium channel protein [Candidatus Bathyarchaeota archaeon]
MRRLKKIEYTPVSVRETLLQLKDISELMIDLSYSAIILNDKELAREVLELEERIDNMLYVLDMNLMLAARDPEDAEALAGVAHVSVLMNAISDAAAEIADLVLNDIEVHPIAREVFKKTMEVLSRIEVAEGSTLVEKTVDELDLASAIGVDIIAIKRGRHWLINPEKEVIMPEDILMARGGSTGIRILERAARGEIDELM